MSNSEKDQSVMGSLLKFAPTPLQDRRLIANGHGVVSSPIRRIDPNSESDGNRKPKKKREGENYGSEKENFIFNAVAGDQNHGSLKVKLPAPETDRSDPDENGDGFRTPTSAEQRIPAIATCPPPPRKTAVKRMRSPSRRRRVLLDLSNEVIESVFPPAIHKRIRAD